ncbi:Auxin response factor 1 [Artemisia annua]|uniref:Auxin response factor 1 n=1 Tax=Artemisia annua TaxID=35608 RepID=A0A2U1LSX6_ARTAN|nr:Auxin response factor 1 [Artemisia annua]
MAASPKGRALSCSSPVALDFTMLNFDLNNVQAVGFLRTAKNFIFLFVETFSRNGRKFIIKRFGTHAPSPTQFINYFFMGHSKYPEGYFLIMLGALLNLIGLSKKRNYPEGFQTAFSIETPCKKLWYECGGPHAYVPREGENVLYFPPGHLEQIEDSNQQLPAILLPPKILCKVVNVQLWVENEQVYAQITLLPHQDQSEVAIPDLPVPEPPCCNVCSFYKTPTACDTSAPGGLRKHTYLSVLATTHHAITAGTRFNFVDSSQYLFYVPEELYMQEPKTRIKLEAVTFFLEVQWDKPLTILPYKVSPWEIELKPSQRYKCSCCLGLKRLFCWGQKVAY